MDEMRAQSSQGMKTFDVGSRNQSVQGGTAYLRDGKADPLKRKLNVAVANGSQARRIGGGELIKLGQKLTEMPKVLDEEKTFVNNSQVPLTTIMLPTKSTVGTIVSRATAAQQLLQQKTHNMPLGNPSTTRGTANYQTSQHPVSLQSSQLHYKL